MGKESTIAALRTLAESADRSETAKLLEIYPAIEAARTAGVSIPKIFEALDKNVFTLSMTVFRNSLYRIRRKIRESEPAPTRGATTVVQKPRPAYVPPVTSVNPRDLDAIMGSAPGDMDSLRKKGIQATKAGQSQDN